MNFVNTSLFVGDLPKYCNENDLEQLFAPYGPVLDAKIKRNVNTGKSLSYGFVTLSTEALAAESLRALDGAMFHGRKLRVKWAMYNARTQNPINQSVINSVYVRFVTSKVDQYVTEEDLHNVFDPFGCVLDVSIKESSIDARSCRQSGYGFVHFSCDTMGIECAFQAVAALDNSTVDGVTYNVELSKNLLKQFNHTEAGVVRKDDGLLSSPSRSASDLRQLPATPHRTHELERVASLDLSPYKSADVATPLRNCSSMSAMKFSPNQQFPTMSPVVEHSLPRTYSGRSERSFSQAPPAPPQQAFPSNYANVGMQKPVSRENSFRSMGARSNNGSFRTLNARSSSANSMSSSFGTTTCTSSPSPFAAQAPAFETYDKAHSFRSDPGTNNTFLKTSNYSQKGNQTNILGNGSHSLSFQEQSLSRSLFPQSARFGASDISLLSVPSQNNVLTDFSYSADKHPPRPDSRASDCSDVSTDDETEVLVLSSENHDLLFSADGRSEDFFAFLNKPAPKRDSSKKKSDKIMNPQVESYDPKLLNLESLTLSSVDALCAPQQQQPQLENVLY